MFKITVIVILMIGRLLATGLLCDTCGMECLPACGTRYFRSCCFNYLRRKRGPDTMQFLTKDLQYVIPETKQLEDDSEVIPSDFEHYNKNNRVDNALKLYL